VPFLAHEAFCYYHQKNWRNASFRGKSYTNKELDLLAKEYKILNKIYE